MTSVATTTPQTAEAVLARVNELVPVLRARAVETEKLRHLHPHTERDLAEAGVFRLTLPKDRGGYEAPPSVVAEILAQISRGCPSTSWITAVITCLNTWAAMLADEGADDLLATPDLRITGLIAPTGNATPVDGGYRVTGRWGWNTGGRHANWVGVCCMTGTETGAAPIVTLIPTTDIEINDTWFASGMAGTATNDVVATDVFVPTAHTIPVVDLANGTYPQRRYSDNPYFNYPGVMFFLALSAPTMVGMARGAMDVFLEKLPSRGITYSNYSKAADAALTHHQVARAQSDLEIAEMYLEKLIGLLADNYGKEVSVFDRVRTRSWLGQATHHAKLSVNQLFEASGASQVQYSAPIQRYFRDVNALALHGALQYTTSDELYGRVLCGLEPNSTFL